MTCNRSMFHMPHLHRENDKAFLLYEEENQTRKIWKYPIFLNSLNFEAVELLHQSFDAKFGVKI